MSPVSAFDETRYKEDRPNLFLNVGMLFKDYEDIESGLSQKGKQFLTAIMDSEKFNVVLIDPQIFGNLNLPISINGSPYFDVINSELSSQKSIQNLMIFENLVKTHPQKLREVFSSPNSQLKGLNDYNVNDVFYELVDSYHNSSVGEFSKGGSDPFKNNEDLINLLFKIGVNAFNEDFDFDSLNPVVSFKTTPPTCVVHTATLDLDTCLQFLKKEYKWINETAKDCGVYEVGKNRPLKQVHPYMCGPEFIIDFEKYVQSNILLPCEGALGCLNNFINQEAGELLDSFHQILLKEKRSI